MQQGFRTEGNYLLLLFVLSTLIGWSSGFFAYSYLIGFFLYTAWSVKRANKLKKWLNSATHTDAPPYIPGAFGYIAQQFYKTEIRHQKLHDLQRQQIDRIIKLANALSEGIVILKNGRELQQWNPAAEKLLGLKAEDRNSPINNILRNPVFVKFIQSKLFTTQLEMEAPRNPVQVLLFTAAVFDEDDVVLVVQDVTHLRRLEKMRKDFVANISHELRTPLTVLTGYIETLQENSDAVPAVWGKALSQMEQQAKRMTHLANDLVTLSQLESTDTTLPETPVELAPILKQVEQDALSLSNGNHKVVLEPIDQKIMLRGNSKELYSAFSNLVFNAIRHNPPGTEITIRCSLNKHGNPQVDIADNGVGIDPKHLPRLTERFYRVDNSRSSASGGTGLGLAIVKHALNHHQATLEIHSKPNQGSTFSCVFRQPGIN